LAPKQDAIRISFPIGYSMAAPVGKCPKRSETGLRPGILLYILPAIFKSIIDQTANKTGCNQIRGGTAEAKRKSEFRDRKIRRLSIPKNRQPMRPYRSQLAIWQSWRK
jgi:hypothetical protein